MGTYSKNIIADYLNSCARHNPDGPVAFCDDREISWGELRTRVMKLANALIGLGVKKDDKVAFMFHNVPEFLEVNYAAQVAGAVPVPMNYRFTSREVEYQGDHCDASVFIFDGRWNEAIEPAAANLPKVRHFVCKGETKLAGALDYDKLVESGSARDPDVATSQEDTAVMIYTGGTTGFPKGVMLTYGAHIDMFANLIAGMVVRAAEIELTPEQLDAVGQSLPIPGIGLLHAVATTSLGKSVLANKTSYKTIYRALRYLFTHPKLAAKAYSKSLRYITPSLPFFHDASYQILMLATMTGNICFVLLPEVKFEPAAILKTTQEKKPILMANVPTGWKKLISAVEFDEFDLSSVRVAITGAGSCPVSLKKKMFEKLPGIIIVDMFGQTEMTPITSFRIDTDPAGLKERSVGKSIVEVRVVDHEGRDVPPGEPGEILYKSSTVMKGYYKDEDKTSEVMAGGWFKSGDLGYIDQEGEVRLIDRKNECINTGGEKVFPLEVEEIIHQHPAVEDVAVIGVPDEEWGHTVRAVVQLKPGVEASDKDIIEFCRGDLAGYKIPRTVVFVKELPLSPVGKVLRAKIRELYG